MNLTVFVKFREIDDLIRDNLVFSEGAWWTSYINAGRASTRSLEVESQSPLNSLFDTKINVDLSWGLSKTWSTVHSLPGPFNRLSPTDVSASFSVDYRASRLPLTMGLNARYNRPQKQRLNENQVFYIRTPVDVSTYVSWKFRKNIHFRLAVDNLLKRASSNESTYAYVTQTSSYQFLSSAYRRFSVSLDIGY